MTLTLSAPITHRRMSLTWWPRVMTALVWTLAITACLLKFTWQTWLKLAPHVIAFLRALADALEDMPNPDRPVLQMPSPEVLEQIGHHTFAQLNKLKKSELKEIAGVTTDHITRAQLISRIQHGKASDNA